MRILNTLLLILISYIAYAQDVTTTYHKIHTKSGSTLDDDPLVKKLEDSDFYRNIYYDTTLNNIKIYRLEEYFTKTNTPKIISYITRTEYPFKYFLEKQDFYDNGKLSSLIKYNISGMPIDTAFYLYPNQTIKMITYRNPKRDNVVSDKSIEYLLYNDENGKQQLLNGEGTMRFPLGKSGHEEGPMINSNKHGLWKGVFPTYTFEETYENGVFMSGESTDKNGKKTKYDPSNIEIQPEYPGGMQMLRQYISDNYKYPQTAIKARVSGTVQVTFIVNTEGYISDIKVTKDLGFGTGEAAEKLVRTFGKWKPGSIRGILQEVSYTLPIRLDLSAGH